VSYVELHCHSAFSFLDGTSQPEELVAAALGQGHRALALTDHDTVSGSMEFAQAAKSLGLRAIHGAEVSVRDERDPPAPEPGRMGWTPPIVRHVTLLVRDATGWRNLCRLLTHAHAHTRDATRRRVIPPSVTLADLEAHAEGLVCLSGCARQGVRDEPTMRRLLAAFGPDLRVELQRPFARHDRALNRGLAALAARLGVACVATGNVHAHTRSGRSCRTRSWRSASTRRSTPPSRCAGATTRTCSPRPGRWPRASRTTPRRWRRPRAWRTR
jgi:error-prone DNA polymerase